MGSKGLQTFDALHLANAEYGAQVFLTVDDKFRRNAQQITDITIAVYNPLTWLSEILENGNPQQN